MGADQRKRRLNGTRVVEFSSEELYKEKRESARFEELYKGKRESARCVQHDLCIGPHISLEWDDSEKRVVAKKEQICISRRHLTPFIGAFPLYHKLLADVFMIPSEIFGLGNLEHVLSFEVWKNLLSEKERNNLTRFLPKGADAWQVVRALLCGDNLHFGSPFLKWGASLCSGDLHPDLVVLWEKRLKANKKAYYSSLQKYHFDMLENFQQMKEIWEASEDSENEFMQHIWRARKFGDKSMIAQANEYRIRVLEENCGPTSESCSWVVDEKAYSSDNQNFSVVKDEELQTRSDTIKYQCENPIVASAGGPVAFVKSKKGETLLMDNIQQGDGANYMSYIKISKKQHQLVKSLKPSGKSIPSRLLNHILGNLGTFDVQPYEKFEEDEWKIFHKHWLLVANRDLPIAFANWSNWLSRRREMTSSLVQEMGEKLYLKKKQKNDLAEVRHDDVHMASESDEAYADSESGDADLVSSPDDDSPVRDELDRPGNLNSGTTVPHEVQVPSSSGCNGWPVASTNYPYYPPPSNHEFPFASGLSLRHPGVAMEDQQRHLIDQEAQKSDGGHPKPYPNLCENELIQPIFRGHEMLSYHNDHKQTGLEFFPTTMGGSNLQLPLQLPLPTELGQRRPPPAEVYMSQNGGNILSDGGAYFLPRQGHLPLVDWAANFSLASSVLPMQPHPNGGEMFAPNWFPGNFSGSDDACLPGRSIGNGGNTDGSLFSVLSHCNNLCSRPSSEQLIPSFGVVEGGAPRNNNVLPPVAHPLDYFGSREDVGLMNLPHRNLNGKPFLRSWHR